MKFVEKKLQIQNQKLSDIIPVNKFLKAVIQFIKHNFQYRKKNYENYKCWNDWYGGDSSFSYIGMAGKPFFKCVSNFRYKFNSHYPVKLRKYVKEFEFEKLLWLNTFNSFKSKVYVTNHKWDPYTIPASNALNEIGGISIFYQTSYYEHLDFVSNIIADIYFCFSNKINKIEE